MESRKTLVEGNSGINQKLLLTFRLHIFLANCCEMASCVLDNNIFMSDKYIHDHCFNIRQAMHVLFKL